MIDGGFLELVRLRVRHATDYHVMESMHEYDTSLRMSTNRGMGFYRYIGDRYNFDDTLYQQTRGMIWPLLTGERGHYELARAIEEGQSSDQIDGVVVPYVHAIERFATESLMIPEQVWDGGEAQGLPTGAATPLGWAHGEYIKLLKSRELKTLSDRLPKIADRVTLLENKTWAEIEELHRKGTH